MTTLFQCFELNATLRLITHELTNQIKNRQNGSKYVIINTASAVGFIFHSSRHAHPTSKSLKAFRSAQKLPGSLMSLVFEPVRPLKLLFTQVELHGST